MAVDSGNITKVVEELKAVYPDKAITIFADNDKKNELKLGINTGIKAANDILQKYTNIKVAIPSLSNQDIADGLSDFNDLFIKYGINKVRKQIKQCYFKDKITNFTQEKKSKQELEIS